MFRKIARRFLLYALPVAAVCVLPMVATSTPASAVIKCADLTITNVVLTPASPIQNENADVAVTVLNQGSCAATGFVVQFKQTALAFTGPSQSITSLAASTSTTIHLTYAFPTSGNFLTQTKVDSGNGVDETIENNNLFIKSITVQKAGSDLQVTGVTFNPNPSVATDPMTATVHVVNNGNTDAGPFRVNWRPGPLFAPLQSQQINSLAATTGTDVVFDYTYANPGTFNTTATADPLNQVHETNELNNSFTTTLTVDPALPDLVIESAVLVPANPTAGLPAQLQVKVQNVGHRPADDFQVKWKPSPLASPLSLQVNGPLNVGNDVQVNFDYTFPLGGDFTGTVTADSTFRIAEVHEDNNSADVSASVAASNVDLTITSFTSTGPSQQGMTQTFHVTVQNNGTSPADNFELSINPDSFQIESPSLQTLTTSIAHLNGGGATTTVDFPFVYPDAGNFRAIAEVDAFHNITETNEQNNKALLDMVIATGDTNLTITDFTLSTDLCAQAVGYGNACSPMLYFKGSAVTATIKVKNTGSFAAGSFTVQWLPDDTQSFGPTAVVPGVLPGDTVTVTIKGSYPKDGTFESKATVDLNNTVPETNETVADNTATINAVNVLPRDVTVSLDIQKIFVITDLDNGSNKGDWHMWMVVYDPNSDHCTVSYKSASQDIPTAQCPKFVGADSNANDGHNLAGGPWNNVVTVNLKETDPLIFAITGLDDDSPPKFDLEFLGLSYKLFLGSGSYYNGEVVTMNSIAGDTDCPSDGTPPPDGPKGHCFDSTVKINITKGPPPLANE